MGRHEVSGFSQSRVLPEAFDKTGDLWTEKNDYMNILEINILKTKSETVRARADVHFEGFVLKGFKVLFDSERHKEYVTPPSYHSFMGWRPLFKTDTLEDWQEIQRRILDEYNTRLMNESITEEK